MCSSPPGLVTGVLLNCLMTSSQTSRDSKLWKLVNVAEETSGMNVPSKANTTTIAAIITEDASRADLERQELNRKFLEMSADEKKREGDKGLSIRTLVSYSTLSLATSIVEVGLRFGIPRVDCSCSLIDRGHGSSKSKKANAEKSKRRKTETRNGTHMFIHVAWNVGHIEVGVGLVRELLELGIERFLRGR
jgi:hypothetical protein